MTAGIVVPSLGLRPTLLAAAVESVVAQQSLEQAICVVVPASGRAAVAALLAQFPVLLLEQRSVGMSAAIDEGWRALGDTDYVAWLGDDDVLCPGAIDAAVTALEHHPRASAAVGRCDVIDAEGRRLYTMASGRTAIRLLRYGHDLVMQPGALFRRQAVEDVGGLDKTLHYAMDYDLFLRLRDWGPIVYLPQTLAAFRWHPDSLTASNQAASRAEAALVRRRYWRNARWEPAAERVGMTAAKVLYWAAKRRVR